MFYMERLIIDTINNEPNRVISVIYLYKNRLTLYKETDLRCEEMILKGLLNECIDYFHLLNNNNLSLNIINSIGYRSGKIYLTSNNFTKHNTPYNQKDFLNFLNDFQTRTRNYIRKQTSFFSRFYKKFSNKIPITIINSSEEEVFNKIIDFLLSIINKTTIPINDTLPKPTLQEYKLLKIYKPEIKLLNKEVINNLINKLIKRINQSELLSYFD